MSRPIAYNASGPLSGSIRGGTVNYTVDSGDRNYLAFAGKKWVPSADGVAPIVFVTDSYTQGYELDPNFSTPLFFACSGTGSAAIIYTANRLPGSPGNYIDANVALSDLITARGYFILESNDPFEGIDADGLAFDVDASKMSSYPQTGTSWYDVSGNGNYGTLTNGPTWNLNGWFQFDGVDDYSIGPSAGSIAITGDITVAAWVKDNGNDTYSRGILGKMRSSGGYHGYGITKQSNRYKFWTMPGNDYVTTDSDITDGRWHYIAGIRNGNNNFIYVDGNLQNNVTVSTGFADSGGELIIGRYYSDVNQYYWNSYISSGQVYSSALSTAEIKQNYFGSPIVTDGLVFAVDANNIVSYPKSGTAAYSLTGSITNTLVNGVGYSLSNGGSFSFDGTDDYISGLDASFMNGATEGTFEAWINTNSITQGGSYYGVYDIIIGKASGPDNAFGFNSSGYLLLRLNSVNTSGNTIVNLNSWNHVVGTWNSTNVKIYLNGVLDVDYASAGRSWEASVHSTQIGRMYVGSAAGSFTGKIANLRVYNKALTAAEIQQNYQAEQYRFEGPAGPVTNGLVLNFDAGNLDSYPGTGTTWYTLAGSNNGTLTNGPSFSTEAGGCIVFDGVDDYVSFGNPLNQAQLSQVWTVQAWINITTKPVQLLIEGLASGLYIEYAQGNNSLLYLNGGVNDYYTYGGQFTAQGWVLATFRFNNANGDRQIWRNLSNISTSGPNNTSTPSSQSSTFKIGSNSSSTILGKIGNVLFYNRYLSDAEITQNYNSQKGRFGL